MKGKQVTAVLLSAVLSLSSCLPLSATTVFAAESEDEATTVDQVQEDDGPSAEEILYEEADADPAGAETAFDGAGADSGDMDSGDIVSGDAGDDALSVNDEDQKAEPFVVEEPAEGEGREEAAVVVEEPAEGEGREEAAVVVEEPAEEADGEAPAVAANEEGDLPLDSSDPVVPAGDAGREEAAVVVEEPAEEESVKTDAAASLQEPDQDAFANAADIAVGDVADVSIGEGNGCVWFRFTPEEDGIYIFYSADNEGDPYGGLYDAEGNQVASSDDDGGGGNFRIEASLEAGQTCYLQACCYGDEVGSYQIHLDFRVNNHLRAWADGSEEDSSVGIAVTPGEPVDLKVAVSADDMSGLTYEWVNADGTIEGAEADAYTVESVDGNTDYYCYVRDRYGNSASVSFYLHVENHLEVSAKDGITDVYALPGGRVVLQADVSANDKTGLALQWLAGHYNAEEGWWDAHDEIEGATDSSYVIEDAQAEGLYRLEATDRYGNRASVDFHLHVEDAYLVASPAGGENSIYVVPGTALQLKTVVQAPETSTLTFRWDKEKETEALDWDDRWAIIEGADTDSLDLGPVTKSGEYRFTVTDQNQNENHVYFYVCAENHLRVVPAVGDVDDDRTWIELAPGAPLELKAEVSADDTSALSGQWYYWEGMGDTEEFQKVEGAVSDTYSAPSPRSRTTYRYEVHDQYGNRDVARFYIRIVTNLSVSAEKEEITAEKGGSAQCKANVSVDPGTELTYAWYDDVTEEELSFDASNPLVYAVQNVQGYRAIHFEASDPYGNTEVACFKVYPAWQPAVYPGGADMGETSVTRYYDAGDIELYVNQARDEEESLTYAWYDADTGEALSEDSEKSSYKFAFGSEDRNIRCHVADAENAARAIDLYYHIRPNTPKASEFAAAKELRDRSVNAVSVDDQTTWLLYRFVPAQTGDYVFCSDDNKGDPYVVLYDASYQEMDRDDDGGGGYNFLLTAALEKGKAYYIQARAYSLGYTADYTMVCKHAGDKGILPQEISAQDLSLAYGETGKVAVTGAQGDLSFTGGNAAVATVDAAGNVAAKGVGTAKITIAAAGTDEYLEAEPVTITVTVTALAIGDGDVSLAQTAYTYDGKAKKPAVTVKKGSAALNAGTDYTVAYSGNVNAGTDTAKVTVTGKGNYAGTVVKTFSIARAAQTITGAKATYKKTYGNAAFSLGAKARTRLTYKTNNAKVAAVNAAGKVTIKGAGTAKITITAAQTGNYKKAARTVTISVAKAAPTIKAGTTSKAYKFAAVKKKAQTFSLGATANSKGKLTYANASAAKVKKAITVNAKTGKITVKKGTKKGTYKVKVKITAAAKGNYKKGTRTVTVTVRVK